MKLSSEVSREGQGRGGQGNAHREVASVGEDVLTHGLGNKRGVQHWAGWQRNVRLLKVGFRLGSWTDDWGGISQRDCRWLHEGSAKQVQGFGSILNAYCSRTLGIIGNTVFALGRGGLQILEALYLVLALLSTLHSILYVQTTRRYSGEPERAENACTSKTCYACLERNRCNSNTLHSSSLKRSCSGFPASYGPAKSGSVPLRYIIL